MRRFTQGLLILLAPFILFAQDYGVYEYIIQKAEGSFTAISSQIENAVVKGGIKLIAQKDMGVPEDCGYKARVFVLYDSGYAAQIMQANPKTGAFAVTDRINLFQDEAGTHIAVVNPHSLNRTILMDDKKFETLSENHLQKLRALITGSVKGTESHKQYGEIRDEGYISRTMGVMAGGDFVGKIETMQTVKKATVKEVAEKLKKGLAAPGKEWGLHAVYALELPAVKTVVFGISGDKMEAKSYDIVGAGDDDARDDYQCAGLAHAAAYPFKLVLTQKNDNVNITYVTAMFRMKIFFEDAGKWAFMKNMTMPGSLSDELEKMVKASLH